MNTSVTTYLAHKYKARCYILNCKCDFSHKYPGNFKDTYKQINMHYPQDDIWIEIIICQFRPFFMQEIGF